MFMAAVALTAVSAENPFTGTFLMTSTSGSGYETKSVVTVTSAGEQNVVDVTGLVSASAFEGTTLKAVIDETAGTMTFASGQNALYYESPAELTLFKESDDSYAPAEGSVVAKMNADGGFSFEGVWGFYDSADKKVVYVVTEAELKRPNSIFNYDYRHSSGQNMKGAEPLLVKYENDRLTISGFSPILTDPLADMVFVVDRETSTASLADPKTPNSMGWTGERYLCTVTSFSGNFQNPNLAYTKNIECRIEGGNTLVFPDRWGIVTINPDEPNADPAINGFYSKGTLVCDFKLSEPAGIAVVGDDSEDSAEVIYYDLSGRRISHPSGMCIMVKGSKATKLVMPVR